MSMAASLWDAEDVVSMPNVRDMEVGHVGATDVDELCRRHHYARRGGSAIWNYGLWHGVTLLGAVAYNNPTRTACGAVFGPEHADHVLHMGRLVVTEAAPRNSESRLIGGSLRLLAEDKPDCWAVLTYAATSVGHVGYVYQATNAIYTGMGGDAGYYLDERGFRRSTKQQAKRVTRPEAVARGWTFVSEPRKHRYLYVLGNKTQRRERMALLRLPSLPYPKAAT